VILLSSSSVVNSKKGLGGEVTKMLLTEQNYAVKVAAATIVEGSNSYLQLGAQKSGKYLPDRPVNSKEI
jgi:hypothetical protein